MISSRTLFAAVLTATVIAGGCASNPPPAGSPPASPTAGPSMAAPATAGAVTTPANAQAAPDEDPAGPLTDVQKAARRHSLELLEAHRYAELDVRMNGFQESYRKGAIDDVELLREFAAFMTAEPVLDTDFGHWVEAFPQSYAARLCRGIYYFKSGVQTRGTKYISKTTREQVRGMDVYLTKAQRDLDDSLALDVKPLITYHYLIEIAMEHGARQHTRRYLDAALGLDPTSIVVRRPYLTSLETRWGGSLEQMRAFVEESRRAGLTPMQIRSLDVLVDREQLWLEKQKKTGIVDAAGSGE